MCIRDSYNPSWEKMWGTPFSVDFSCRVKLSDEKGFKAAFPRGKTLTVLEPIGKSPFFLPITAEMLGGPRFYTEGWKFVNDKTSPVPQEMWQKAVSEAEGKLRMLAERAGKGTQQREVAELEVKHKVATISYRPSQEEGPFHIAFTCRVKSPGQKRARTAVLNASSGVLLYPYGKHDLCAFIYVDVPDGPEFYLKGWKFVNDDLSPVPQGMWDDAVREAKRELTILAEVAEGKRKLRCACCDVCDLEEGENHA